MKFKVEKSVFENELTKAATEIGKQFDEAVKSSEDVIKAVKSATYLFTSSGEVRVKLQQKYSNIDYNRVYTAINTMMAYILAGMSKQYGKFNITIDV